MSFSLNPKKCKKEQFLWTAKSTKWQNCQLLTVRQRTNGQPEQVGVMAWQSHHWNTYPRESVGSSAGLSRSCIGRGSGGSPPRLKSTNYPNLQSVTEARTILQWNSNFFSLLKNAHSPRLANNSKVIYNGKIISTVCKKISQIKNAP